MNNFLDDRKSWAKQPIKFSAFLNDRKHKMYADSSQASILLDFDGTITTVDTVDAILERFAEPRWRDIEAQWDQGMISSRECMTSQTSLIRATPNDIDALVDSCSVDPGVGELFSFCQVHNIDVRIVSDGYDRCIHRIMHHLKISCPIMAGHLSQTGFNTWALMSQESSDPFNTCSSNTCKCKITEGLSKPKILIGDGRSDFCVAKHVDLILAKGALARYCEGNKIPSIEIRDISEAVKLLPAFLTDSTGI